MSSLAELLQVVPGALAFGEAGGVQEVISY